MADEERKDDRVSAMPLPEWLVIYHNDEVTLTSERVALQLPPSDFWLQAHRMLYAGEQATHATVYRLREGKNPEFVREVVL